MGAPSRGLIASITEGFIASLQMIGDIIAGFGSLVMRAISGAPDVLSEVTGPVGIFNLLGQTTELGFIYLVQFVGILSLNLTVLNLLPIPALDGGRLLFIGIEKIIGRRLHYRFEATANIIGFALLILLALVVTLNDTRVL